VTGVSKRTSFRFFRGSVICGPRGYSVLEGIITDATAALAKDRPAQILKPQLTTKRDGIRLRRMRLAILCLLASSLSPSVAPEQAPAGSGVPVIKITKEDSSIKFHVKASVPIDGTFDQWDATATMTSPDVETGVLDIKIQAASVNTGSGMKDGKLKSKDFFDAEHDPLITFHSTKIVQTGPNTLDYVGDFTIRGVSKPEKLTFTLTGKGTGSGEIKGTMAFDRKDYGMNKGIPLVKIADRVEVIVDLKGKRISGPPLVFKQ
jgi:polyisoprenoid-binding protein YceI